MYLLLLRAVGVSMDIDQMKFENLALIAGSGIVAIALCFMHGITLKWGDKEIVIGGLKKLLSKKDEDTRLKESLKRFTDDADNETEADLYDLVEDMDARIEQVLLKEHCRFTLDKFAAIVKTELYKRLRRNSLKDRLAEASIEKYVDKIIKNVEERYELFQAKVDGVKCGDSYTQFVMIKEAARKELMLWAADARLLIIRGMKKKIAKYESAKAEFKTASARKFCCDDCIAKNKAYIQNLTGMEVEDENRK